MNPRILEGDLVCGCCGGLIPHGEGCFGHPMGHFCLNCEAGCKRACKAHQGHDLRQCRVEGCWRDGDE